MEEMKQVLSQRDQTLQQKDKAYNEILQLCVTQFQNDKSLMARLRVLKFKHTQSGSFNYGQGNSSFMTNVTAADEAIEGTMSVTEENLQLKRDLEFATSEIERLRSKLIIDSNGNELQALTEEANRKHSNELILGDLSFENINQ